MNITDEEMQRRLNAFDDSYEEQAPLPADVRTGVVILVLSAALSVSGLYWVWRLAHG